MSRKARTLLAVLTLGAAFLATTGFAQAIPPPGDVSNCTAWEDRGPGRYDHGVDCIVGMRSDGAVCAGYSNEWRNRQDPDSGKWSTTYSEECDTVLVHAISN